MKKCKDCDWCRNEKGKEFCVWAMVNDGEPAPQECIPAKDCEQFE